MVGAERADRVPTRGRLAPWPGGRTERSVRPGCPRGRHAARPRPCRRPVAGGQHPARGLGALADRHRRAGGRRPAGHQRPRRAVVVATVDVGLRGDTRLLRGRGFRQPPLASARRARRRRRRRRHLRRGAGRAPASPHGALRRCVVATGRGRSPDLRPAPGQRISNISPPTFAILVLGVAQAALLLAAHRPLSAWLQRPRAGGPRSSSTWRCSRSSSGT